VLQVSYNSINALLFLCHLLIVNNYITSCSCEILFLGLFYFLQSLAEALLVEYFMYIVSNRYSLSFVSG
jgi:hypothetical protein